VCHLVVLHDPALPIAVALAPLLVLRHSEEAQLPLPLSALHNRRDELQQEAVYPQQARPEVVYEVDQQAFDVRAIVVLVSHDHQVPVAQLPSVSVVLPELEPQDAHHVRDLLVLADLCDSGVPHIEQLALEREHTVVVTPYHAEATDSQSLSRVSLLCDSSSSSSFSSDSSSSSDSASVSVRYDMAQRSAEA
jgi:hypothetical protein